MTSNKMNFFKNYRKAALFVVFLFYTVFVLWQMFLGPFRTHYASFAYNVVPFKTVFAFVSNFSEANFKSFAINIFGNILIFVPFGMMLPLLFKKMKCKSTLLLTSIVVIFFLEVLQMVTKVGMFDVDDIILNVFGIYLGYCIVFFILKFIYKKNE